MPLGRSKKLDGEQLREYALKLLTGRALSVAELKGKLRQRAEDPACIDAIVAQLKDYGALNDSRYAEHFAETRAGSGAFGRQRVLSELLKRKVASKVAENAVNSAFEGASETEMIQRWLERKYRNQDLGALLQEPAKLASVYRRLRLAGFASGPAIRVLKRHAANASDLEGMEDAGPPESTL